MRSSTELAWCLLVAGWLLPAVATGQPTEEEVVFRRVRAALGALPALQVGVLQLTDGPAWIAEIDFDDIFTAVGHQPAPIAQVQQVGSRIEGDDWVAVLRKETGEIRYINRSRSWTRSEHGDTSAIPESEAQALTETLISSLGLPEGELGSIEVATQVGAGGIAGQPVIQDSFEMYRVVTVRRWHGGEQVLGSIIRMAVSNDGAIQQLRIAWPTFRLVQELALRPLEDVERQAVEAILARGFDPEAEVRAQRAFLPLLEGRGATREVRFLPSVVFSVLSRPTPYQIAVPVAEERVDP